MYEYIGELCMSFRPGKKYKCEKNHDSSGDFYDILDENNEWYEFSVEYFENNFKK